MKNLLLSYARDLNDAYPGYEFSIWSAEQLLGYFNDALCLISASRPDMFTELKVLPVNQCDTFVPACDCEKIIDVLGQCTKDGRVLHQLQRRTSKSSTWFGTSKRTEFSDRLTEYELVDGRSLLEVFPKNIDPNETLYVLVRCYVGAKTYSLADEAPDENCAFLSATRHWVLANAKMVDGEFSQTMSAQAKEHLEMFSAILGLVKQGDDLATKSTKTTK